MRRSCVHERRMFVIIIIIAIVIYIFMFIYICMFISILTFILRLPPILIVRFTSPFLVLDTFPSLLSSSSSSCRSELLLRQCNIAQPFPSRGCLRLRPQARHDDCVRQQEASHAASVCRVAFQRPPGVWGRITDHVAIGVTLESTEAAAGQETVLFSRAGEVAASSAPAGPAAAASYSATGQSRTASSSAAVVTTG